MAKRCAICGEIKPLQDFHHHSGRSDGRQRHCKSCHVEANREARARRRVREGAGYPIELRREEVRARRARDPEPHRAYVREYKRRNKDKARAHSLLLKAVARGDLERPMTCSRCGRGGLAIHAHHEDYGAPLEVTWLCAPCHGVLHIEAKAA